MYFSSPVLVKFALVLVFSGVESTNTLDLVHTFHQNQGQAIGSTAPKSDFKRLAFIVPRSTVNSGADHRCGPSAGNCAADECCSESGYCGKSGDYCHSPECQLDFGPACDGNRGPSTSSTLGVPRSKVNNGIEYGGAGLFKCTVPGVVAITYDDGPSEFTPLILELLDKYESKATFFVNGNGRGRGEIDVKSQWRDIIQRMFNSGHQIASHTYSHQDLDSMNSDHRRNQMIYNEMALANIIHAFPTYMRPPYSRCYSSDCRSLMKELGYHIINFDSDTKDTENVSVEQEMQSFTENLAQGRRLVIGHDIQENTAKKLTEFMLKTIKENGLRAVTVGECLGDPMENWYRTIDGSQFAPPSTWTRFSAPKMLRNDEASLAGAPESTLLSSTRFYQSSAMFSTKTAVYTSISGNGSSLPSTSNTHILPLGTSTLAHTAASPNAPTQSSSGSASEQKNGSSAAEHRTLATDLFVGLIILSLIGMQITF